MQKKLRGISLLELILVLAVVAILLVIATRFFEVANRSRQVNNAYQDIKTISAASQSWWEDHGRNYTKLKLTLTKLVEGGYLVKSYQSNPWGGIISVTAASSDQVKVEMTELDTKACANLAHRFGFDSKNVKVCTPGPQANLSTFTICAAGTKYTEC